MSVDSKLTADGPVANRRRDRQQTRAEYMNQRNIALVIREPFLRLEN